MRFVRFIQSGAPCLGALKGDRICPLTEHFPAAQGLEDLISAQPDLAQLESQLSPAQYQIPLEQVELLSPLTMPNKIICLALNYKNHIEESQQGVPTKPYFFLEAPTCLTGHNHPVRRPAACQSMSYEAELAIVVGKEGVAIPEAEALEYVFGYTIMNDMSARDLGRTSMPSLAVDWYYCKSFDTSDPLGPCVVTKDEIPQPNNLHIQLTVNGQIKQDGNTRDMVYYIPKIVSAVSQNVTLKPGDIISTGTLGGALGTVVPGDVIEVTLEGVGTLRNPVV